MVVDLGASLFVVEIILIPEFEFRGSEGWEKESGNVVVATEG